MLSRALPQRACTIRRHRHIGIPLEDVVIAAFRETPIVVINQTVKRVARSHAVLVAAPQDGIRVSKDRQNVVPIVLGFELHHEIQRIVSTAVIDEDDFIKEMQNR